MKKRIALLLLTLATVFSLCVSAVATDANRAVASAGAAQFTDISRSSTHYNNVDAVVKLGLFAGKTPTLFAPNDPMTRGQFVMVLARLEGVGDLEGQQVTTIFPDVPSTNRFAGPIKWAADNHIVEGYSNGTFGPANAISRAQIAALVHRYIQHKQYTLSYADDPTPYFLDAAQVPTAFRENVEYCRLHGLINGYNDGTLVPNSAVSRAQVASILNRMLNRILNENADVRFTPSSGVNGVTNWSVYTGRDPNNPNQPGTLVSPLNAKPGDVVVVDLNPADGYRVGSVTVTDANGNSVPVTISGNTAWFVLPEAVPVSVDVQYVPIGTTLYTFISTNNNVADLTSYSDASGNVARVFLVERRVGNNWSTVAEWDSRQSLLVWSGQPDSVQAGDRVYVNSIPGMNQNAGTPTVTYASDAGRRVDVEYVSYGRAYYVQPEAAVVIAPLFTAYTGGGGGGGGGGGSRYYAPTMRVVITSGGEGNTVSLTGYTTAANRTSGTPSAALASPFNSTLTTTTPASGYSAIFSGSSVPRFITATIHAADGYVVRPADVSVLATNAANLSLNASALSGPDADGNYTLTFDLPASTLNYVAQVALSVTFTQGGETPYSTPTPTPAVDRYLTILSSSGEAQSVTVTSVASTIAAPETVDGGQRWTVAAGTTVFITATAQEGYVPTAITGDNALSLRVIDNSQMSYVYTMPDADVTLTAEFEPAAVEADKYYVMLGYDFDAVVNTITQEKRGEIYAAAVMLRPSSLTDPDITLNNNGWTTGAAQGTRPELKAGIPYTYLGITPVDGYILTAKLKGEVLDTTPFTPETAANSDRIVVIMIEVTSSAQPGTPTPTTAPGTPTPTTAPGTPTPTTAPGTPTPTTAVGTPTPTPTTAAGTPTPTPTTAAGTPTPTPTTAAGTPTPTPTYTLTLNVTGSDGAVAWLTEGIGIIIDKTAADGDPGTASVNAGGHTYTVHGTLPNPLPDGVNPTDFTVTVNDMIMAWNGEEFSRNIDLNIVADRTIEVVFSYLDSRIPLTLNVTGDEGAGQAQISDSGWTAVGSNAAYRFNAGTEPTLQIQLLSGGEIANDIVPSDYEVIITSEPETYLGEYDLGEYDGQYSVDLPALTEEVELTVSIRKIGPPPPEVSEDTQEKYTVEVEFVKAEADTETADGRGAATLTVSGTDYSYSPTSDTESSDYTNDLYLTAAQLEAGLPLQVSVNDGYALDSYEVTTGASRTGSTSLITLVADDFAEGTDDQGLTTRTAHVKIKLARVPYTLNITAGTGGSVVSVKVKGQDAQSATNGSYSVNAGDNVSVTVKANPHYETDSYQVNSDAAKSLSRTTGTEETFDFTMPNRTTNVTVSFTEIERTITLRVTGDDDSAGASIVGQSGNATKAAEKQYTLKETESDNLRVRVQLSEGYYVSSVTQNGRPPQSFAPQKDGSQSFTLDLDPVTEDTTIVVQVLSIGSYSLTFTTAASDGTVNAGKPYGDFSVTISADGLTTTRARDKTVTDENISDSQAWIIRDMEGDGEEVTLDITLYETEYVDRAWTPGNPAGETWTGPTQGEDKYEYHYTYTFTMNESGVLTLKLNEILFDYELAAKLKAGKVGASDAGFEQLLVSGKKLNGDSFAEALKDLTEDVDSTSVESLKDLIADDMTNNSKQLQLWLDDIGGAFAQEGGIPVPLNSTSLSKSAIQQPLRSIVDKEVTKALSSYTMSNQDKDDARTSYENAVREAILKQYPDAQVTVTATLVGEPIIDIRKDSRTALVDRLTDEIHFIETNEAGAVIGEEDVMSHLNVTLVGEYNNHQLTLSGKVQPNLNVYTNGAIEQEVTANATLQFNHTITVSFNLPTGGMSEPQDVSDRVRQDPLTVTVTKSVRIDPIDTKLSGNDAPLSVPITDILSVEQLNRVNNIFARYQGRMENSDRGSAAISALNKLYIPESIANTDKHSDELIQIFANGAVLAETEEDRDALKADTGIDYRENAVLFTQGTIQRVAVTGTEGTFDLLTVSEDGTSVTLDLDGGHWAAFLNKAVDVANELRQTTANAIPGFATTVRDKIGNRDFLKFTNTNGTNLGRAAAIEILDPDMTRVWKSLKISGKDVEIELNKDFTESEDGGSSGLLTGILTSILGEDGSNTVDINVEFVIHRLDKE